MHIKQEVMVVKRVSCICLSVAAGIVAPFRAGDPEVLRQKVQAQYSIAVETLHVRHP